MAARYRSCLLPPYLPVLPPSFFSSCPYSSFIFVLLALYVLSAHVVHNRMAPPEECYAQTPQFETGSGVNQAG